MPKDFHKWCTDMSNSIPDDTWTGKCLDEKDKPKKELVGEIITQSSVETKWMVRAKFATLITGDYYKGEDDEGDSWVYKWMCAFFINSLDLDDFEFSVNEENIFTSMEIDELDFATYFSVEGEDEYEWWKGFYLKIMNGWEYKDE